ncbi:MAG TPA: cupin domain-containing protein [Polyangiaceae bacterium]|nr:cupin domain-containing protein [Polyangiaceae bacterium]
MLVNADLSLRAVVDSSSAARVPSPLPGVTRVFLDRDGGEVARATSVVHYAPGSRFSEHVHGGGEEFLVLEGTFVDEHGSYPRGTYVRNPVGSRHAPSSPGGCVLFVKLRQMAPRDRDRVVIVTSSATWRPGKMSESRALPLHAFGAERVRLVRYEAGSRLGRRSYPGGREVFVLAGVLADELGRYPAGTWVRSPAGSEHEPYSDEGCLFYEKTGHLAAGGPRPPH